MEVILKEDVAKLGNAGEVIDVKDGYARNYLIPKGFAMEVNPESLKIIESQRKLKELKEAEQKKQAQALADKLAGVSCTVAMASGEGDKLFGAVTNADIAESLKQENILIDRKDIALEEDIHRLGIYYFKVKLHPEISQRVKLWVVKK